MDLRQVSFEGDISEYDGTLSFYLPVTFDPDAVFGTNVTSDSNGDWLNVYANYDLETGGPEQSLTVVLVCGDGDEFEFSYPLTASDREQLREKMEGYCQLQAGMSLDMPSMPLESSSCWERMFQRIGRPPGSGSRKQRCREISTPSILWSVWITGIFFPLCSQPPGCSTTWPASSGSRASLPTPEV